MRRRAIAITGCLVVFALAGIYASIWFVLVTVRKDDFHVAYYYGDRGNWGRSAYYLDQEAVDVYSSLQSNGDKGKWDSVFAQRDRSEDYSLFWIPMERVHQLLFGISTVVPTRCIENRDELLQRYNRLQRKMGYWVP